MNNDIKLIVDEQQDDKKHLKEHYKEKACYPSIATSTNLLKKLIQETITKKSSCEIIMTKC